MCGEVAGAQNVQQQSIMGLLDAGDSDQWALDFENENIHWNMQNRAWWHNTEWICSSRWVRWAGTKRLKEQVAGGCRGLSKVCKSPNHTLITRWKEWRGPKQVAGSREMRYDCSQVCLHGYGIYLNGHMIQRSRPTVPVLLHIYGSLLCFMPQCAASLVILVR